MKYISFCSGIEAATVAWHSLGWEPLAFCEIEKFPSRVLAHHYPQVPNLGDFTAVDWSQWTGRADVCVGGTPCQAFSVAGLRKSLSDERGNLSLEFIRAVNIIRPQYVVWENVPGVLSTADNAFGCFLAGLVGCEEPIVFEQGWPGAGVVDGPMRAACWRVLDAQYFGLAQRRRRVFVVASAGDGPHPAEILFEWESLRRDSAPRREAGEGTAGYSPASFGDCGEGGGSLRANGGDFGGGSESIIAMCLNGGGMRRNDAESETLLPIAWDEEINAHEDISGTVTRGGDGGRHAGCAVPFSFLSNMGSHTGGIGADICPTMLVQKNGGGGMPAVACGWNGDPTPKASVECMPTMRRQQGGEGYGISSGMAVRRLTPCECERLQGFPDDYTNILGAADGPRYKALGNSMAVPVMRWIGKRIKEASDAR